MPYTAHMAAKCSVLPTATSNVEEQGSGDMECEMVEDIEQMAEIHWEAGQQGQE